MTFRPRPTVTKRQKEKSREERRQRKADRKAGRDAEKGERKAALAQGIDPDIAGIVLGPVQPSDTSDDEDDAEAAASDSQA